VVYSVWRRCYEGCVSGANVQAGRSSVEACVSANGANTTGRHDSRDERRGASDRKGTIAGSVERFRVRPDGAAGVVLSVL